MRRKQHQGTGTLIVFQLQIWKNLTIFPLPFFVFHRSLAYSDQFNTDISYSGQYMVYLQNAIPYVKQSFIPFKST